MSFREAYTIVPARPKAKIAACVLALLIALAVMGPEIIPYKYSAPIETDGVRDSGAKNLAPLAYSPREQELVDEGVFVFPHLLGTDDQCRDYAARVLVGARISFAIGLGTSLMVIAIGLILGAVAGYIGGKADKAIGWIGDMIFSLPDVLVMILLSSSLREILQSGRSAAPGILEPNLLALIIGFATLYWVEPARAFRAKVVYLKESQFIVASRLMGAKRFWIITRHIAPNCRELIISLFCLQVPRAIFTESYLSFLGLGLRAPLLSLGGIASLSRSSLTQAPYRFFAPCTIIAVLVLALNTLAKEIEAVQDKQTKLNKSLPQGNSARQKNVSLPEKPGDKCSSATNSTVLKAQDLTISYPGCPTSIRALSFEIKEGEAVRLTGTNGAGKTTLSLAICHLLSPSASQSGSILTRGKPALIFQDTLTCLNPIQSVGKQIAEAIRLNQHLTKRAAMKEAVALLNELGFTDPETVANMRPGELSGGMRQRVAVAIALGCKPSIIIADEPTSALDRDTQQVVARALKKRLDQGVALIVISHSKNSLTEVCSRTIALTDRKSPESSSLSPHTSLPLLPTKKTGTTTLCSAQVCPVLEISGLCIAYPQPNSKPKLVVKDFSLTISPGECVALTGPSGAGKTSVARGIMGLTTPTSGSISLCGKPSSSLSTLERAKRVQLIWQNPASSLDPLFSIEQSIIEPLIIQNPKADIDRANNSALERSGRCGIPASWLHRFPSELSGGQLQQVAIARALASQPSLIIADEATSNLDSDSAFAIIRIFRELTQTSNLALLFICHDQTHISSLCPDRTISLRKI